MYKNEKDIDNDVPHHNTVKTAYKQSYHFKAYHTKQDKTTSHRQPQNTTDTIAQPTTTYRPPPENAYFEKHKNFNISLDK